VTAARLLSWRGLGCGLSQPAPPQSPIAFVPLVYGVGRRNLLQAMEFCRQHTQHRDKYSTTLLEEFTFCDVVSVTFSFLATRLRATLCGLLGGAGKLASKLVGGSWLRGTLGSPGRLNLDRSWNHS
jgi:hypothetical protein